MSEEPTTPDVDGIVYPAAVRTHQRIGLALRAPTMIQRHVSCPECFCLVDMANVLDHWNAVHPESLERILATADKPMVECETCGRLDVESPCFRHNDRPVDPHTEYVRKDGE